MTDWDAKVVVVTMAFHTQRIWRRYRHIMGTCPVTPMHVLLHGVWAALFGMIIGASWPKWLF